MKKRYTDAALLRWYHNPKTHPATAEMVRLELARRGVTPKPRHVPVPLTPADIAARQASIPRCKQ